MRRCGTSWFVRGHSCLLCATAICITAAWNGLAAPGSAEQQPEQMRAIQQAKDKSAPVIQQAINAVLNEQIKAWNAGDIDGFMAHYWNSNELTFSSGGKTTRSWKSTLERYKQRYPDKAAMGTTTFKNLEITPLGDTAAMVLGEWQLKRENGQTIGGNFTLVLRKIEGRWLIIHDHTSQAPAA